MIGEKTDNIPDLIEPLIGYRYWRYAAAGLLSPYDQKHSWNIGPNRAVCMTSVDGGAKGCMHAPGKYCRCGLYAYHSPASLEDKLSAHHSVMGAVAMWGTVEMYETGMRAQYARPIALCAPEFEANSREAFAGDGQAFSIKPWWGSTPKNTTLRKFATAGDTILFAPRLVRIYQQPRKEARAIERLATHYGVPMLPKSKLVTYAQLHGTRVDL